MKRALLAGIAGLATLLATGAHAQKSAGEHVDDGTITSTIKAGLLDNHKTSSMHINVESYRGTVQLSGFVESQAEKDAAAKVASSASGVKQVVNSLLISPATSMGGKLDDTVVTGKVKTALMNAQDVKSMQINVETRGGVAQLAGFVTSAGMKDRAGSIAAGVSGVKRVDNALIVKPKE